MKEIKPKEFKKIELDMLEELTNFLEEHNLRYILDYGTLLGAIRHNGFIPWDDDIDITMPREDYDKLYKLLKKQKFSLTENYKLASYTNKYNINKIYYCIVDIRTITESNTRKQKYWYPVWIDIFSADYISRDKEENINAINKIEKILGSCHNSLSKNNSNNLKQKITKFARKKLIKPTFNKMHKIIKFNNLDNKKLNIYFLGKFKTLNIDYFNNYIYKEFEGHKFRVPKKYDQRLKTLYGNYMELPKKEDRTTHFTKAYFK